MNREQLEYRFHLRRWWKTMFPLTVKSARRCPSVFLVDASELNFWLRETWISAARRWLYAPSAVLQTLISKNIVQRGKAVIWNVVKG